ncbi:hypothetical protein GQ53DRAFT_137498 [Thozetella sp. PMI_491]|nr:hypothetical protein GQ53DRAFT_137498 [Thozetella sp. PMI_491]
MAPSRYSTWQGQPFAGARAAGASPVCPYAPVVLMLKVCLVVKCMGNEPHKFCRRELHRGGSCRRLSRHTTAPCLDQPREGAFARSHHRCLPPAQPIHSAEGSVTRKSTFFRLSLLLVTDFLPRAVASKPAECIGQGTCWELNMGCPSVPYQMAAFSAEEVGRTGTGWSNRRWKENKPETSFVGSHCTILFHGLFRRGALLARRQPCAARACRPSNPAGPLSLGQRPLDP